jgi:hypothetical protein
VVQRRLAELLAAAPPGPIRIISMCAGRGHDLLGVVADLERTVRGVSMLGRTGMAVIWTRHRLDPDLTPTIRRWFRESGFQESSFDALETENRYAIGVARLVRDPAPFTAGLRLFTFTR